MKRNEGRKEKRKGAKKEEGKGEREKKKDVLEENVGVSQNITVSLDHLERAQLNFTSFLLPETLDKGWTLLPPVLSVHYYKLSCDLSWKWGLWKVFTIFKADRVGCLLITPRTWLAGKTWPPQTVTV